MSVPLLLLGLDLLFIAAAPLLLPARRSDLIVVLGNTVLPDGTPAPRLQARLDAALRAWRAGLAPRILVSGGVEPGRPPRDEARIMAAYLQAHGVPPAALLVDSAGETTAATARNAASLHPRPPRLLVVTQWFHVARSVLALRQNGFKDISAASPRFAEPRDLYSFTREAVALPVYLLRHRL